MKKVLLVAICLLTVSFVSAQTSSAQASNQRPIEVKDGVVYVGGLSEDEWQEPIGISIMKTIFSIIKYGIHDPKDLAWYSWSFTTEQYDVKTHKIYFKDGSFAYVYSEYTRPVAGTQPAPTKR